MTGDVVINVELRRMGGPGARWEAAVIAGDEDGTELAHIAGADSPGTALDEVAVELDRLETSAIMALESRAEDRLQDRGY